MTEAPPTPPRRWRARSKGVKQINMNICTTALTRRALAVFKSNFRSGRFSEQNARSDGVLRVQSETTVLDETQLAPTNQDQESCLLHCAGPWFALLDRARGHAAKREAPCPALMGTARLPVLSERGGVGNPRRRDGVAGVCSDQEEIIMSPVALVHAAPTWMDDVLADSFPGPRPPPRGLPGWRDLHR